MKCNGRSDLPYEFVENVQQSFLRGPEGFVRIAARELKLSKYSVHQIPEKKLIMKAYKLHILLKITLDDKLKR